MNKLSKRIILLFSLAMLTIIVSTEVIMQCEWQRYNNNNRVIADLPGMVIYLRDGKQYARFEENWIEYYR